MSTDLSHHHHHMVACTHIHTCVHRKNPGMFSFIIAPNSNFEFSRITSRICILCRDTFILAVANAAQGPLGRVYGIQESARCVVATSNSFGHTVDHLPTSCCVMMGLNPWASFDIFLSSVKHLVFQQTS